MNKVIKYKIVDKHWCPGDYNSNNPNTPSEYYCNLSWYDENTMKYGELKLKCRWEWKKSFFTKKKIITFTGFNNIPKWLDENELKEALSKGAYSNDMYNLMRKYNFL